MARDRRIASVPRLSNCCWSKRKKLLNLSKSDGKEHNACFVVCQQKASKRRIILSAKDAPS